MPFFEAFTLMGRSSKCSSRGSDGRTRKVFAIFARRLLRLLGYCSAASAMFLPKGLVLPSLVSPLRASRDCAESDNGYGASNWQWQRERHQWLKKIQKSEEEWKKVLTPNQYHVTRQKGTEPPFTGEYESTDTPGTYKCVCCGQPLFASDAKFHSGCGWPSFTAPSDAQAVTENTDKSHGMERTEVLCSKCDAHLGHVF